MNTTYTESIEGRGSSEKGGGDKAVKVDGATVKLEKGRGEKELPLLPLVAILIVSLLLPPVRSYDLCLSKWVLLCL